ncbi:alpha/beta hydrolase [Planctomycetota bacterium]|nr:alpha/beta hydrolase [Planctomycetota bacterium]
MADVAPSGYAFIALSYPHERALSYEESAAFVKEELKKIDGDVILLAESFSGPTGILLASEGLEQVKGLVLVGTFTNWPNVRLVKHMPWRLIFGMASWVGEGIRQVIWGRGLFQLLIEEIAGKDAKVLADRMRMVGEVNVVEQFKQIDVPMVYLRGKWDVVVPRWNVRKMLELQKDMEVVDINSSHLILQTQAEAAWEGIQQLFDE